MKLGKVSRPVMQNLADLSGESVILTIRDGMSGVAIEIVEGTQAITWKTSLGNNLPLHCGASKKVLLAFQSPEFIEQYLKVNACSDSVICNSCEPMHFGRNWLRSARRA
ncbi:HTH-type transcriptional regulator KipR [Peptococcaceae bacterium CEB3]|nr:HTH-type transcriptional regulator KipR [Peptococcaceae bacterium CEB3]